MDIDNDVIVTLALALGGTGITAYAAQDSLPDQPLYGVKTLTEDLQLQLNSRTKNQLSINSTIFKPARE